jgi:hypothetical protein
MKKYELLDEGHLSGWYTVRALKDFGNVKKGERGGQVAGEHNLSQEGDCWIGEDVRVLHNARVEGNALVYGKVGIIQNAVVKDNARVYNVAEVGEVTLIASCLLRDDVFIEFKAYPRSPYHLNFELSDCELRGGFKVDESFVEELKARIPPTYPSSEIHILDVFLYYGIYNDSSYLKDIATFSGLTWPTCRIQIKNKEQYMSKIAGPAFIKEFTKEFANKFDALIEED